MNPFNILGVEQKAGDEEIRKAYLKLVRQYPPDQNKEVFQKISKAYELIKNAKNRCKYNLFNRQNDCDSPLALLCESQILANNRKPLPQNKMKEFLQQCAMS